MTYKQPQIPENAQESIKDYLNKNNNIIKEDAEDVLLRKLEVSKTDMNYNLIKENLRGYREEFQKKDQKLGSEIRKNAIYALCVDLGFVPFLAIYAKDPLSAAILFSLVGGAVGFTYLERENYKEKVRAKIFGYLEGVTQDKKCPKI